jgi:hypothetical protein
MSLFHSIPSSSFSEFNGLVVILDSEEDRRLRVTAAVAGIFALAFA